MFSEDRRFLCLVLSLFNQLLRINIDMSFTRGFVFIDRKYFVFCVKQNDFYLFSDSKARSCIEYNNLE